MVKVANDNHVIIVDDSESDIELARICYGRSQLTNPWLSFTSGEAVLDYLRTVHAGAAVMPALVLLDINMPSMTGFEVLAHIRDEPAFAALPIVCMLTSSGDPRDQERASELGASGFTTKPDELQAYVDFFNSLA